MYARELAASLRRALHLDESAADTDLRLEKLRSYGQLPRGRSNASVRLSDQQIASAILGFVPKPGWAGHVALVMGDLRPVGGKVAFAGASNFRESIAAVIASAIACKSLVSVTFVTKITSRSDEYRGLITLKDGAGTRRVHFVSKMATSLLQEGADERYDADRVEDLETRVVLSGRLLTRLRRDVEVSRHLNLPLKTDWSEYTSEEERDAFHARLGARPNSTFLNLSVEGTIDWPAEPLRVSFERKNFVLFPTTQRYQSSISLDLANEKLTAEQARTLLNRFLSLLSWCDQAAAVLGDGWSGNPVPVPITRGHVGGSTTQHWYFDRALPTSDDLLQRLAYYREGHNARHAGLVTFEVLSFFKVFESRSSSQRGHPNPTKAWMEREYHTVRSGIDRAAMERFESDLAGRSVEEYVYENCRVATAHTSRAFPSDADSSLEIRRLYAAADIIHAFARHYIIAELGFSESRFEGER